MLLEMIAQPCMYKLPMLQDTVFFNEDAPFVFQN